MNICFYAPFKHLLHPDPSGDQTIGKGLYSYLERKGHTVWTIGTLRCRWIYWKPWRFPQILSERRQAVQRIHRNRPDLWLTYHTYYKAPDVIGPAVCRRKRLPYIIFQGVYATKRKRRIRTWPGFLLNTKALKSARHVFTNKQVDFHNLRRIIPAHRLTYVVPGLATDAFSFSPTMRQSFRQSWQSGGDPVILSAAMFRSDVKTEGLALLIRACGRLSNTGRRFQLVIAGAGKMKSYLTRLAEAHAPGRVRFIGKVPREQMAAFYSAGDLFVFPGIRESLGMVFLEAQSCGLPVIAFSNAGTPEVVRHRKTGILAPAFDFESFVSGIAALLDSPKLRQLMGRSAKAYVRAHHELDLNYQAIEQVLQEIVHGR